MFNFFIKIIILVIIVYAILNHIAIYFYLKLLFILVLFVKHPKLYKQNMISYYNLDSILKSVVRKFQFPFLYTNTG